jgi:hypothetical protein
MALYFNGFFVLFDMGTVLSICSDISLFNESNQAHCACQDDMQLFDKSYLNCRKSGF